MKDIGYQETAPRDILNDHLTNQGRELDSERKSKDNLSILESMVAGGGWSKQLPAVICPMTNWLYVKGPLCEDGCTAQEYIDRIMLLREATWAEFKKAVADNPASEEATDICNAFENLYTIPDPSHKAKKNEIVPRVLYRPTIKSAFSAHSGHQRLGQVFTFALAESYRRIREDAKISDPAMRSKTPPFKTTVPCLVYEFDDLTEVLKDQLHLNSAAGYQNGLTVADYARGADRLIGTGAAPGITEQEYKNLNGDSSGGRGGGAPRAGYLFAEVNSRYRRKPGFLRSLLSDKEIRKEGEPKPVPNPDYLSWSDFALTNADPLSDVSVIARLVEPSLKKLVDYNEKYGPDSKWVKGGKENLVSPIETEVLKAGKPWSEERFQQYLNAKYPNRIGYQKPVKEEKVKKVMDTKPAEAIVNSDSGSELVRALLAEQLAIPMIAGQEPPKGIADAMVAKADAVDAIFHADKANPVDAMYLELNEVWGSMRQGNPSLYATTVEQCHKMVAKAQKDATSTEKASKKAASK